MAYGLMSNMRPLRFSRRRLLAMLALAPMVQTRNRLKADQPQPLIARSPVVDAHIHCFAGKKDERFPYHPRAPYRPENAATPQHLLQCMDEVGIDYGIIVHPEPYQDDHRYLEYCLEVGRKRLKGTCLFFADRPGSLAGLSSLVKKCPVVAIRVHAYAPDRLPPFGKPELRDLWRMASENGLAVQIHLEPRYAPGFEPMIKEFAKTKVIIDHLGRPFQGTPEEHERVVRWSDMPNTVLKLSAVPEETKYPHRSPGPVIKRLVAAFGTDRVIYGGGFGQGATPSGYRQTLDRVRSFLDFLPKEDQSEIVGGNAARLFGFGPRR